MYNETSVKGLETLHLQNLGMSEGNKRKILEKGMCILTLVQTFN